MNLRDARLKRTRTLKEVADAVATDVGNLSRIERGQVPGRDLGERLVAYYDGDVSWADFYQAPASTEQSAAA